MKMTKFRACVAWLSRSDAGQTDRRDDRFTRLLYTYSVWA